MDATETPGRFASGPHIKSLSKFRELLRAQKREQEEPETPVVEFEYKDCDCCYMEISEYYSYLEQSEFLQNRLCYEEFYMKMASDHSTLWSQVKEHERKQLIQILLDELDSANPVIRESAARALLYIAQGIFGECETVDMQQEMAIGNCFLLYKLEVFQACVQNLNHEISANCNDENVGGPVSSGMISVYLNIIYSMVVYIGCFGESHESKKHLKDNFIYELGRPFLHDNETLPFLLFETTLKFCSGNLSGISIKKIVLLLWKILLVSLGGTDRLRELNRKDREAAGLDQWVDERISNEGDFSKPNIAVVLMKESTIFGKELKTENHGKDNSKCTLLKPKVRKQDIDAFLDKSRLKFLGYSLEGDNSTDAGLPDSVVEGLKILKSYLYVSLSEWQLQNESQLNHDAAQNAFKDDIPDNPTELLYQLLLPKLQQYMIALLKILLVASPTTKTKSESFNILIDVLPKATVSAINQTKKITVDMERHKEIIIKAVSAILLLLLKHFKVNHVLQFEHMAQSLVFANCIPLILKHLNQNLSTVLLVKDRGMSNFEFPTCVLKNASQAPLVDNDLDDKENTSYSWRSIFACINLTKILQKLTKWKPSRIMMLVVFKSGPILKRALRFRESTLQFYLLKLIKPQLKYLGRNWRKTNMKIISMIYQRIRHHLTDDWAYGIDQESRPWDYQMEESKLRTQIEKFNNRRYDSKSVEILPECAPFDTSWISVLGEELHFTETFKKNYQEWLHNEVFQRNLDWNSICIS